jgi:hypothetical protein
LENKWNWNLKKVKRKLSWEKKVHLREAIDEGESMMNDWLSELMEGSSEEIGEEDEWWMVVEWKWTTTGSTCLVVFAGVNNGIGGITAKL